MNFKNSIRSISLVLMTVALMSVSAVQQDVFAKDAGMSLTAIAEEDGNIISISGETASNITDVIITVTAPNGNLVSVDQVSPDTSGEFATDISVGGPLWSQDGAYTVTAQQGSDNSNFIDSVQVDIADGLVVPEFGTIAAMILAVAIISIVAISAKSRLSIVPRY